MVHIQASRDWGNSESESKKMSERRTHIKVIQADSQNEITKKVNEFIDVLYDIDPDTEIQGVNTDNTPGNWFDATIIFKSTITDTSGLYNTSMLNEMAQMKPSSKPYATL